jgi:hypothetical protein
VTFNEYIDLPDRPVRMKHIMACQQPKLCGFCAMRIAWRALDQAVPKILGLIEDSGWKLFPYLLTLTQPTGTSWRVQAERLWAYWSKALQIRRDGLKRVRHRWSPLCEFAGGIIAGEAKVSKSDPSKVHYHAHGVVLGPPGLAITTWLSDDDVEELDSRGWVHEDGSRSIFGSQQRWQDDKKGRGVGPLAEEWRGILGNPDANLELRPFLKCLRLSAGIVAPVDVLRETYGQELQEVFRYTYKWDGMSDERRWQYYKELSSPRIQERRAFGNLVGAEPSESFVDDLSEFEGQRYVQSRYSFSAGVLELKERHEVMPVGVPRLDEDRIRELIEARQTWAKDPEKVEE